MRLLLNIDVPDLAAAQAFYVAAFDLTPARHLGDTVLELSGADISIYLLESPAGSEAVAGSQRDYARHWSPVHVDWVVDDLDVALSKAKLAGARQEAPIREAAWGRIVRIGDPFGHGWCLLQFTGRGYDEIAS